MFTLRSVKWARGDRPTLEAAGGISALGGRNRGHVWAGGLALDGMGWARGDLNSGPFDGRSLLLVKIFARRALSVERSNQAKLRALIAEES